MTDAGTLVTGPHEWVTYPGRQRHGLWTQLDELRARPGGEDRGWPAPGHLYRPLAAVEWLEVPRNGPVRRANSCGIWSSSFAHPRVAGCAPSDM